MAFYRLLHRTKLQHIAFENFEVGVSHRQLCCATGKSRDGVSFLECLLNQVAADAAG
jgi:hypothetical protein